MNQAASRQEPNIGEVIIDPAAEAPKPSNAQAAGRAEEAFFEQARLQDSYNREALKIGWLGRLWGYSAAAPVNIAGAIALVSLIVWITSALLPGSGQSAEIGKNAFTLITTCLAYIFGAATSKKAD